MRNQLATLILAFTCSSLFSFGQNSLSLSEAQAYALKHSPSWKYAEMDQEMAELNVKKTVAIGLPQLNGSAEFQDFIDIPTQLIPGEFTGGPPGTFEEIQFGTDQNMTFGISGSQLIFDGSFFVGLQASKVYAMLMQENVNLTEWELRNQVSQAYYSSVIALANVDILRESRETIKKSFDETKAFFEAGFVEEQDVDQLQLSLTDLDNQIQYSTELADVNIKMLQFIIGMPLSETLTLTDPVEQLILEDAAFLLSTPLNLEKIPMYQIQKYNVELRGLQLKNEKALTLPSIGGFYAYSRNAQRNEFDFFSGEGKWYPTHLWGIQAKIPIFTGLGRYRSIQEAQVDVERANVEFEQGSENLRLQYKTAMAKFRFSLENFNNKKANYDLSVSIHDRTTKKYNEGVSSSFELTQARNQMLIGQGEYVNSALQLLNAKSELRKALNLYY